MAYLNVDLNYFEHPKTRRLEGLLGPGSDCLPIRLWCYCGRVHPENGTLKGYSGKEIESVCGWWGESGQMVDAMVKIGFLDATGESYQVCGWLEHQGHIVSFQKRARFANRKRWGKYATKLRTPTRTPKSDIKESPYHTIPNHTKPNLTIPYQIFDSFWDLYPRKVAKASAFKAWGKIKWSDGLVDRLLLALKAQVAFWEEQKTKFDYIPHPATWLNNKRWEDQVKAVGTEESSLPPEYRVALANSK